jgi:hypothetical protein
VTNHLDVSKLLAYDAGNSDNFVSVSKIVAQPVTGPFPGAVSVAKMDAVPIFGPPTAAVSVPKIVAYAISTTKVIVLADYTWPGPGSGLDSSSFLVPQNAKLSFIPYNISGGQGFTNVEQVLGVTPGRWRLDLSNIAINSDARAGLLGKFSNSICAVVRRRLLCLFSVGERAWCHGLCPEAMSLRAHQTIRLM